MKFSYYASVLLIIIVLNPFCLHLPHSHLYSSCGSDPYIVEPEITPSENCRPVGNQELIRS